MPIRARPIWIAAPRCPQTTLIAQLIRGTRPQVEPAGQGVPRLRALRRIASRAERERSVTDSRSA